jgi:quercetin dioxygenase-like cupin family protein
MPTMSTAGPIVRSRAEGERRWFAGGGLHTWKATAEETGGAFLLFEDEMTQGKRTPLHTHPDADESMYVLDGEILMHIDGQLHPVRAGGLAVAPRGVPHAFLVVSPTARLLCLQTPGCCQAFYLAASDPVGADKTGPGQGDQPGEVDFGRVRAAAQQHGGIVLLGPPPFDD